MLTNVAVKARPLPGGDNYAEGVVLGVGAFGVATAIVGGVGVLGVGWMYMNPWVVDRMRARTLRLRGKLEDKIGGRLKALRRRMVERGPILSDEAREKAGRIAEGVGGKRNMEREERNR